MPFPKDFIWGVATASYQIEGAPYKDGYRFVEKPVGYEKTAFNWPVTPKSMYWLPRFIKEHYNKPLFIAENGLSNQDVISLDGKVHDPQRIDFLSRYLHNLKKAGDDGVDIRGFFQ